MVFEVMILQSLDGSTGRDHDVARGAVRSMHYHVQQNVIKITIGHYNFCCNKLVYNIKIQQEFLCLCKDKSTKFMMSVDDQKTFLEERQDRIIDIISWTEVIGRHVVENVNDDVTFWQGPRLLITNITIKHNYCIIDRSIGICWILSSSDNGIRRASSQPEQWRACNLLHQRQTNPGQSHNTYCTWHQNVKKRRPPGEDLIIMNLETINSKGLYKKRYSGNRMKTFRWKNACKKAIGFKTKRHHD